LIQKEKFNEENLPFIISDTSCINSHGMFFKLQRFWLLIN